MKQKKKLNYLNKFKKTNDKNNNSTFFLPTKDTIKPNCKFEMANKLFILVLNNSSESGTKL